jgi:hypothetical protein
VWSNTPFEFKEINSFFDSPYKMMKTLLQVFEQKSNYTSNLGLKFWWWALETIIHQFYSEGFEYKIYHAP